MTDKLANYTKKNLPNINLKAGDSFFWSPKTKTITYNPDYITDETGQWAYLHEIAHAILGHTSYKSDLELLQLEVEAWNQAKTIGKELGINIDDEHVQDCLDTYRDWLHSRSKCPNCSVVCLQSSPNSYLCHNCGATWAVSNSRFCRPYRLTFKGNKKRPQSKQVTFS